MRNKIKLIFLIVGILILLFCVFVGRVTANSYQDNIELEDYLSNDELMLSYCEDDYDSLTNRGYLDNNKIETVDDLLDEDTIVVKVKLVNDYQRKIYYECVLSQIEILECYRGNLNIGDNIFIFEPVICIIENNMLCSGGYSLMLYDKEYIMFLKPLKNTFYGTDEYVYAPNTSSYSKYPNDDNIPMLFTEEELERKSLYTDIMDEEIYMYNQEDYDKYLRLKNEVIEKYND